MISRVPLIGVCVLGVACGGDGGGTGPTTTYRVAGPWPYESRNLKDGRGNTCSTTGSELTFTQSGNRTSVGGTLVGGTLTCSSTSGSSSGNLGAGALSTGAIRGDSVDFSVDRQSWRSFGTFHQPRQYD